jgi:hypothetical protein
MRLRKTAQLELPDQPRERGAGKMRGDDEAQLVLGEVEGGQA